jgi:hypothetical protein
MGLAEMGQWELLKWRRRNRKGSRMRNEGVGGWDFLGIDAQNKKIYKKLVSNEINSV